MTKPLAIAGAALVFSLASLFLSLRAGSSPGDERAQSASSSSSSSRGVSTGDVRAPRLDDSDEGLRRRVAALEHELASLRRQRGSAASASPSPGALTSSSPEERAAAEATLLDAIERDPAVRERLEDLVGESLRKQDERRWESRRARWDERANERLEELAEKASLRSEQVTKLSVMLSAEREEMAALFQKAREEGGGWREMREQVRELRARTDENARAVLDEDQLPAYEAMREEDRPGRGRRGRDRAGSEEGREQRRE